MTLYDASVSGPTKLWRKDGEGELSSYRESGVSCGKEERQALLKRMSSFVSPHEAGMKLTIPDPPGHLHGQLGPGGAGVGWKPRSPHQSGDPVRESNCRTLREAHTHPSRMPPLILSGHFWHMDHLSVKFIPAMSIK